MRSTASCVLSSRRIMSISDPTRSGHYRGSMPVYAICWSVARFGAALFAALLAACGASSPPANGGGGARESGDWTPGPALYDIGVEQNLEVPMDDGVVLRVDVKYPVDRQSGEAAPGPFPSLLTQTPYGKNLLDSPVRQFMGGSIEDYLVQRGYIAVIADVRGRGASDGDFAIWSERESRDVGLQNLMAGRAKGLAMRQGQHVDTRYQLLIGPWTHTQSATAPRVAQIRLRWFDRWLKDVHNGVDETEDTIHFNILGTNRWVDAGGWPLRETTSVVYYLQGGRVGSGVLSLNDGGLSTMMPAESDGSDRLPWTGVSSPCEVQLKVQTAGLLELTGVPLDSACGSGADLTKETSARTYTTEPFDSPKIIAGPINVTLYASSTRPDAEFIVNLKRVTAMGNPVSIQSGALLSSQRQIDEALSWRDASGNIIQPHHPFLGPDSAQALTPGEVTRFDIGVWPTAFLIDKGERLRITLSSLDIPFALPGIPTVADLALGIYDVQHNSAYPSSLIVPMADPSGFARDCRICETK